MYVALGYIGSDPIYASVGERWIFGVGLGEGMGTLVLGKCPGVVLGDRLTCSSA